MASNKHNTVNSKHAHTQLMILSSNSCFAQAWAKAKFSSIWGRNMSLMQLSGLSSTWWVTIESACQSDFTLLLATCPCWHQVASELATNKTNIHRKQPWQEATWRWGIPAFLHWHNVQLYERCLGQASVRGKERWRFRLAALTVPTICLKC